MRKLKLIILFILRVVGGLIAIWQIIGLLPVLSWLKDIGSVTAGMWGILGVKLLFLVIGISLYKGLKKPYDRLKAQLPDNESTIDQTTD